MSGTRPSFGWGSCPRQRRIQRHQTAVAGRNEMTLTLDRSTAPRGAVSAAPGEKANLAHRLVALLLIAGPIIAVAAGTAVLWGHALHPRDVVVAVVLYAITGHGITVGLHRMFTHRSFQ